MGGRGSAGAKTGTKTPGAKQAIRDAYSDLPKAPGGWVGLADLRDKLKPTGLSRKEIDDALINMVDRREAHLSPVANQKSLRPRDREAALRIGDTLAHMISIDDLRPHPGG